MDEQSRQERARAPGFYWIKLETWEPAQLLKNGQWELLGFEYRVETDDLSDVGECLTPPSAE